MNDEMHSGLFPPNFPAELSSTAFVTNDEAAWPLTLAVAAVEWFGAHGYAVLGTELWVVKDERIQSLPTGLSGMREVHGNSVDRESEEAWSLFVARAAEETLAYLRFFNLSNIVELGQVLFNVVWVSETDFAKLTSA